MKRLIVIKPEAPPPAAPKKEVSPGAPSSDRRRMQRRRSIGRRVNETRRATPVPQDPLFAEQRDKSERRGRAQRRRRERRAGIRVMDLTNLDLSEMDS